MTLSHRTVFTEAPNPHISFCWGRMQPPHRGHMGVINTVKATAKAGAWAIFVTKTHDNKKNPLTYDQKVKWLYALYPETKNHLVVDPNIRTIMQAAVHLYDKGFRSATFVAGEDDMPQLRKLLEDYNGKQMDQGYYNFEPFSFMESPRILNATNARQAAKDGDPDAFERATQVPQNLTVDGKTLFQTVRLGLGLSEDPQENESFNESIIAESLSVEQLAHISDKALDDAYHYGLSTPGANFGWLANIESAAAAKRMIDSGIADVDAIASAIHDGWNKTAVADYMGKLQLDTPTIPDKKKKRYALAQQTYGQLPEVEKEKDRVVARAMLQALGVQINEDLTPEQWNELRITDPKAYMGNKDYTNRRWWTLMFKKARAAARESGAQRFEFPPGSKNSYMVAPDLANEDLEEAAEKNKIDEEMFRGEDGFIDMLEYAKFVVSYATGYDLYESIDIENLNYINSLHDEYSIKEPIIGKNYSAIFPMYVGKNTIQMFGHHAPLKLLSIDNDHYIFEKSKRYPIEYESVEGNGIFKTFILDPTMVSQLLTIMELRYNVKSHIVESAEKSTKATAKYQAMPRNGQRCDHCTMWRPPHGCSAVSGKIAPNGWCSYYKRSHRKDLDENMDHDKDGQAVEELKAALLNRKDSLQGKDSDEVYKIIDKLMTSVAKAHGLTGQEIHDMWVEKYKEIPDTWIMNESQLDEAASSMLFHYTGSVGAALNILKNNEFALSISTGTVEAQYAPKGYNYFLSATRSKVGGYHQLVGDTAVMFNLDGNWFNKRYPVKAIDYWAGMYRGVRHSESEDRIFSREPSIPADAITAIHILLKEKGEYASPTTRQLMILAKKRGLPTYLYTDDTAWRLQDTRRALPVSAAKDILSGIKRTNFYVSSSNFGKRMLGPWLELIFKKKRSELSKKANDLRYSLTYWNGGQFSDDLGLRNEISNARKPGNSGYAEANKIIAAMRKIGASDVKDLLMFLHKKWDAEAMQPAKSDNAAQSAIAKIRASAAKKESVEEALDPNETHGWILPNRRVVYVPQEYHAGYLEQQGIGGYEEAYELGYVRFAKATVTFFVEGKLADLKKMYRVYAQTALEHSNVAVDIVTDAASLTLIGLDYVMPRDKAKFIKKFGPQQNEHAGSIIGTVGGGNDYSDRQVATFPWDRWVQPDTGNSKLAYVDKKLNTKKR